MTDEQGPPITPVTKWRFCYHPDFPGADLSEYVGPDGRSLADVFDDQLPKRWVGDEPRPDGPHHVYDPPR